jgi:hypothetical protein
MKFKSSRLKKYGYNIQIKDFEEALQNNEIIALSDSQMLRTIRDVIISKTNDSSRILDRDLLEKFYTELNFIRKRKHSNENVQKIKEIKSKINKMCYIPEYITIIIEDESHYDYLYENGLSINGIKYFRLSVSAGQGRVSTVVFGSSEVLESVNNILDNERDKTKKFSPSKFNAYKGTYGSATKVVTTPRWRCWRTSSAAASESRASRGPTTPRRSGTGSRRRRWWRVTTRAWGGCSRTCS